VYSVHNILDRFHFLAQLITISPIELRQDISKWMIKGDAVITLAEIKGLINKETEALVIRTTPNSDQKKTKNYNHSNWPYITKEAAEYIREMNVQHLLIDLPSVDKEEDGGMLVAHRAYWNYPKIIDLKRTITELIYVPDFVKDGMYVLNLSIANIDNDASPSRPILYDLSK
jgi:kynurenine formamidase